MTPGPKPRDPADRFWEKVDVSGSCWLWTGALHKGYGAFHYGGGSHAVPAHCFAYELMVGPIPKDRTLDHRHTCPKNCVNPAHLRPATQKQQMENLSGAQRNNHSSGIRGVTWNKRRNKWQAQAQHHGKMVLAGLFDSVEEATEAIVAKRLEIFTHNDMDRAAS